MKQFVLMLCSHAVACHGGDDNLSFDGGMNCLTTQMCLAVTAVDDLPPPSGRIVVAWQPPSGTTWSVTYDRPWMTQAMTHVLLSEISGPPPGWQFEGPCGPGVLFGSATVVLSTDPDSSGAITSSEINEGYGSGDTYGIHQEVVTWSDIGCGATSALPGGLEAGVHVYRRFPPVTKLDGSVTTLQTCFPHSAACAGIENPF